MFTFIDKADHSEKMTPEMIKRIVGGKESLYALSKELGCSYSYLRLIKQGKIYKPQVAQALKELGLSGAEAHTHDIVHKPNEHINPTANSVHKPEVVNSVPFNKVEAANIIEKCCGKLKEAALRRIETQNIHKFKADTASKTQGVEISRVNENKLTEILAKCVGSYIKSGTRGLHSIAKYRNESAKISYAREVEVILERKEFFYDHDKGIATYFDCKFKIHCPIQLDINGDELKKAIQSSSPKLKSTFRINIGLYGDKKSFGAKRNGPVALGASENEVGSHARGVASLFNGGGAGEFKRRDVGVLISELTEYLNRADHANYKPYSPIFLNTYSEVGNGRLQMILDKKGAKESNGRKEEGKRYGRRRIEESYTISYPVIISYKGKDIGEIPNAYTSTFTHTTQYVDDGNEYASAYETADRTWSHTKFEVSGSLQNAVSKLLLSEGLM